MCGASGGDCQSVGDREAQRSCDGAGRVRTIDSWQSPFRKDPFEIPLETQLALLLAADAEMRRVKGVTLTETDLQFRKIDSWFASSIGSRIHQRKMISGCGIVATAFQGEEIQKRSYPNSFGGQHALQGYELVESLELLKHAPRVAEEAVALHSGCAVSAENRHVDPWRESAGIADS